MRKDATIVHVQWVNGMADTFTDTSEQQANFPRPARFPLDYAPGAGRPASWPGHGDIIEIADDQRGLVYVPTHNLCYFRVSHATVEEKKA